MNEKYCSSQTDKILERGKTNMYRYLELLQSLMRKEPKTLEEVAKNKNDYNYPGVYVITRPDNDEVVYVGKTESIRKRMNDHLTSNGSSDLKEMLKENKCYPQNPEEYYVRSIPIDNSRERGFFEHFVISVLKPPFNKVEE